MEIEIDEQKVDEAVLALLYLTMLRTSYAAEHGKAMLQYSPVITFRK